MVVVDPTEPRELQTAVIAASRALVGTYGPEAYLAALLGVPAVAFTDGRADEDDLRVAAAFLNGPPFGPLYVLRTADGIEAALDVLDEATSLAGVG